MSRSVHILAVLMTLAACSRPTPRPQPALTLPPASESEPQPEPQVADTTLSSPPAWRPSPERIRAIRGDYLGMFAETVTRGSRGWFTAQYCGESPDRRTEIRRETNARSYTHLLVTYALTYPGYLPFNLASEPERFRDCLNELFADALVPVVIVVQSEAFGFEPTRVRVEPVWNQLVSIVGCDRMPVQIMGWEWNDFVTLQDQRALTQLARQTCPAAYLGVHFTPDRWAASPPRINDPGASNDPWNGSEADYWHDMQALGVNALFFQSGDRSRDLPAFRGRLGELSRRLRGTIDVPPAYTGLTLDLVAMEYCDPHNESGLTEQTCRDMGVMALGVPGVTGFLNGGR